MSTSEPDYFYLPLRDAKKSLNMRINLMAKVSKIGTIRKSRGSDYVLALKLVDRYESPPGLSVNLFADKLDKLPQARSTGDIISLHHVEMKLNNGEFFCTFNGKSSSFALFDGEASMDLSPYQTSINYQAADNDKKLLMQLRGTSENKPEQALVEPMPTLFCNLKAEENLTVVCKVFHVRETSDGDLVLFVWDATDSPLVTLQIEHGWARTNSFASRSVSFVKRDFVCIPKGLWRGALTPNSYFKKLSDADDHVQCRQRIFNGRNSSKVDGLPLSVFPWPSNVTETDLAYSSYSTLMESLAYPEIMHKFTSVVRVVTSYPWQAKDLRSPATGNYRVRLTIEDPTARIHAYIFGEDGFCRRGRETNESCRCLKAFSNSFDHVKFLVHFKVLKNAAHLSHELEMNQLSTNWRNFLMVIHQLVC